MFNIIIDSREQQPWIFQSRSVGNIISKKLDTGDYSIEGFENILCIERKKSVSELAGNITEKRFIKELERMSLFKYKFLILEFDYYSIDNYPESSGLPKHIQDKIKITGAFIMKMLSEMQIKYGIHVIVCGNTTYASYIATNIMKRVSEIEICKK